MLVKNRRDLSRYSFRYFQRFQNFHLDCTIRLLNFFEDAFGQSISICHLVCHNNGSDLSLCKLFFKNRLPSSLRLVRQLAIFLSSCSMRGLLLSGISWAPLLCVLVRFGAVINELEDFSTDIPPMTAFDAFYHLCFCYLGYRARVIPACSNENP